MTHKEAKALNEAIRLIYRASALVGSPERLTESAELQLDVATGKLQEATAAIDKAIALDGVKDSSAAMCTECRKNPQANPAMPSGLCIDCLGK